MCERERERELGHGLIGEKFMAKREKEGEMNEEGAEGGWTESGMNEQGYSGTPSRESDPRCSSALTSPLSSLPPCSELGTRAVPAKPLELC